MSEATSASDSSATGVTLVLRLWVSSDVFFRGVVLVTAAVLETD